MLELSHADSSFFGEMTETDRLPINMRYGGDTINTSVYLSRESIDVSYVTGLGDDILSDWLLNEWAKEGVECSQVIRMENSVPAMYMINVAENGERSFLYWRKNSPASRLFDEPEQASEIFNSLQSKQYVYLSGISLAILEPTACERLLGLLRRYRQQGGKIIFDGNYRPNLWASVREARRVYQHMYAMADIALPTFDDEALLFGYGSPKELITALDTLGVKEIVVKMGEEGCYVMENKKLEYVKTTFVQPVDTTAAGDSFNAGYLAARFKGQSTHIACEQGHKLASKVIQHKGAIIPRVDR